MSTILNFRKIFKTITSDIDKTRQSLLLFNKDWDTWKTNWNNATGIRGKIGSLFASTAISQSDVQAIQAYNSQIDSCVTSQTAFNRTMLNASPAAQNLVASCNGAKVSMQQLSTATQQVTLATKASHIAMKAFSISLNIVAYTAIIKGVQLLSETLYDLANAEKVASENADELYNESSSNVQKNEEEVKSLEELIQKYKDLKENEYLDLDGRKEVKEIQNDIANLVGIQAKNLDLVNGKLDDEIKKLNEISKKEAKQAFQDAEVNYYNAKDAANKAIGDDKVFFTDYDYAGDIEVDARNALKEAGFGVYNSNGNLTSPYMGGFGQDGVMGGQMVVKAIGDTAQEKYDYLQSMIEVLEQYGLRDSKIAIGLKEQAGKYEDYITNQQNAGDSLVDSWIAYSQFSNNALSKMDVNSVDSFENYRKKMIDEIHKDETIGQMMADGILSKDDLESAINDFMATSVNFSTWYEQWKNGINDETSNDAGAVFTFKTAFNAADFSDTKEKLLELAKSGELTPYTISSTSEYNKLLKDTGLTAEQVYKKIMKVAKGSMDATDWQTTLDNSRKNIIALKEMKNSLSEDGISAVSGDVVSNYPELIGCLESETDLRKGINGLISDYETKAKEAYFNLVQDSESYYSNLKKNESAKLNTASKTINAIVNANKTLVSQLGGAYNVDLKNFKSVAQAKASLEQQLIINSAKAWSKYYKVQLDASKNTAKVVADGNFNSGGTGGSDSIKAYEEQSKAQNAANTAAKAYNEAINSLKNITYDTVLPEITNPSGDTDKAKKSTTKFSQAIDWCAQTLSKLSKTIDLYSAKLENNTNSVKTQIKYYKELLNAQNNIVKGYAKTESKYKSTYNKALKKLSKSDQKKVKDGTYTIEQFSGTTKKSGKKSKAEKRYNNIQKALEARDNYLDAQTDSVNAKNQLQEYAEDLASVRWEDATEKVEKLNNQISVLDTRMSNVSGYKAKNKVLQEQLDLQKNILTKQENAYENTQSDANAYYKKISSKYKKNKNKDGTIKTKGITDQTQLKYIKIYNAYVKQLAEDSIKLAQAQEDYTAAVQEATITRAENIKADYDNKLALIDAKANELDNQIALAEAKGQVASVEYYKQLGQNSDQRMTQLKSEKTQLEKQLATLRPYSDEWYEVKQAVIEVDEEIANETVNAVENINKQIEAMDELTNKKNDYMTHISDSLSWFEGLVDEEDMYDDDGNFTDKGLAVLQSKLGRIEASRVRQENALKRLQELDKQYEQGLITEAQYLTARNKWEQQYQDEISTTADIQDELNDITKKGLEMQSDALSELIEKKKKMIDLDQSEYDYQKSIAEKTKNITDLQKQLAMLEGDNSEEGKAQRQKLEVELKDAQEDLADTQYEKYVERLEDALDDLQDRFDDLIEKLDNLSGEEAEKQAYETVEGNEANIEKGKEEVLSDAGAGTEFLNKDTDSLFSGSADDIGKKLDIANDYAEKTFNATVEGNDGTADLDVTLEEVLGKSDLNNQIKLLAGDAEGKSDLNKYLMSQGYNAMNEKGMLSLVSAILSSEYTSGMNSDTYNKLASITSSEQLTAGKDPNSTDNKNAMLEGLKYVRANEFIANNATKAKYSRDKYGALNKKIYDITGGKVLNDANAIKLASMFNVRDDDSNGDINGEEGKKLVKLLENAGFANGGIVEAAVRKNGDDGIGSLQVGEAVLTPVQTTAFTELAKNIVPFNNLIGDIVERPNIPTVDRGAGAMTNNTIESVNFEFTLPNVTDKESLLNMIRNDKEVQRAFQNSTVGLLMSGNKQFNSRRL